MNHIRKTKHYNIYVGKNIESIKKILLKRIEEKPVQIPKVIPGGLLQMSNGQVFEVWSEDQLCEFAQQREYTEIIPIFDFWDEESLEKYEQEKEKYPDYIFCKYCGSKREINSKKCKYCGSLEKME